VPAKLHAAIGSFDDILFPEKVCSVAERCPTDFYHHITKQECTKLRLLSEAVGNKIAFVPVVETEDIRILLIHFGIRLIDEPLTFASKQLQKLSWDYALENEVAIFLKLLFLGIGDVNGGFHHNLLFVCRNTRFLSTS
jgi:hypothetical protein